MIIYILLITIWFLMYNKIDNNNEKETNRSLAFCIVLLFLIMGLRNIVIGSDTESYCLSYTEFADLSFKKIFDGFFVMGKSNYAFYVLNKIVGMTFPNEYTVYLLVVSGIISYAIYLYLKSFSCNYFLSLEILLALGFIFFFMSGVKQTLAMAFVLLAFIELYNEKILKFLLLVFLATLFHNTALVVLVVLPIYKLNIKRMYFVIIPMLVVITLIFKNQIAGFLGELVSDGKYGIYGTEYVAVNNLTGLYIQLMIIVIIFVLTGTMIKYDKKLQFFVSVYSVGIFFQALTPVIAEFFRISMYFSISSCVMIPYAVKNSRVKPIRTILYGMIWVFLLYFFITSYGNTTMIPYKFFWESARR